MNLVSFGFDENKRAVFKTLTSIHVIKVVVLNYDNYSFLLSC